MKQIEVYSSDKCTWCVRARALLESRGLEYEAINISSDKDLALEMRQRSGRRTVPQIFIDGEAIGGFAELHALGQTGKLD